MYIETVPNRNSPPAILLRESYREAGKIRKRTLCNLSHWPYGIHAFDWVARAKPAAIEANRAHPARMVFGPGGL